MSYQISFLSPWYLCLLALLPVVAVFSYRSLASLGSVRRIVAIVLRSLVLALLVFALAEIQIVRTSPKLTVLFLLDHSLSVSADQHALAIRYINDAILNQRNQNPEDRAGVIVFGREPAVEIQPLDEDQQVEAVESRVNREFTNLAGAMKLAQGVLSQDTARRVVIITDGNENLGDAKEQAQALIDAGIGIDVVPIQTMARGDVAVEKVTIPSNIRKGEPFGVRVLLNNTTPPARNGGLASGKVRVYRKTLGAGTEESEQLLGEESVTLAPGRRLLTYSEKIDDPDFYTYEARFVPDDPAADAQPQNNAATTFTHVRGSGRALLIEDHETAGQHAFLVGRLKSQNLEVSVRSSSEWDNLFTDLGQLQPYDTVILANIPRERFSDDDLKMLVRNTQLMGAGLIMLGGANSFGAGGWTNTPIEEAMPVDFQIKGAEVAPVGALAMIMHASEMADGNHWQKVIAMEAIKTLGHADYCGVLHWDGTDRWLWPQGLLPVGANRSRMLTLLDRMMPGDMPNFEPGMITAYNGLMAVKQAANRHLIIISDGDPVAPGDGIIRRLRAANITASTVAVGFHSTPTTLKDIAAKTGGKFWPVTNAATLPRIFQREARRVARPLVYENKAGFRPQVTFPHEILQGIDNPLPPLTGYVRTSRKQNSLAEVSMLSPLPDKAVDNPVLASWTFGQGKAVAFTPDAGTRWATQWTGWAGYDKFFSQLVRWSMRPVDDAGKFTIAADVKDGKLKVVVTALDNDDQYLNFLNLSGNVVGPDVKPVDLELRQVAPGRYIGEIDAQQKGNYFVTLSSGTGKAPLRAGASVPYSDEFRDRQTNEGLLATLAAAGPKGGVAGKVINPSVTATNTKQQVESMLQTDVFRHDLPKAVSNQDVWHLVLLLGSCLFFFDVFVRRVTLSFAWVGPVAARVRDFVLRRQPALAPSPVMERLRSRKAAVGDELEQRRAATRFEPTPDAAASAELPTETAKGSLPKASPAGAAPTATPEDEDSYTNRLLKAKQQVWEDRNKERK